MTVSARSHPLMRIPREIHSLPFAARGSEAVPHHDGRGFAGVELGEAPAPVGGVFAGVLDHELDIGGGRRRRRIGRGRRPCRFPVTACRPGDAGDDRAVRNGSLPDDRRGWAMSLPSTARRSLRFPARGPRRSAPVALSGRKMAAEDPDAVVRAPGPRRPRRRWQ